MDGAQRFKTSGPDQQEETITRQGWGTQSYFEHEQQVSGGFIPYWLAKPAADSKEEEAFALQIKRNHKGKNRPEMGQFWNRDNPNLQA